MSGFLWSDKIAFYLITLNRLTPFNPPKIFNFVLDRRALLLPNKTSKAQQKEISNMNITVTGTIIVLFISH
jgi:hypothetical protein